MKTAWVFVFTFLCLVADAQVSLRRGITLGKHRRSRGFGIDWVTVAVGRTRTAGGPIEINKLIIDVSAFWKQPKYYSYQQLAERVYGMTPGIPPWHFSQPWVPYYLLVEPPAVTRHTTPVVKIRR